MDGVLRAADALSRIGFADRLRRRREAPSLTKLIRERAKSLHAVNGKLGRDASQLL
jgi:hypothetical protein